MVLGVDSLFTKVEIFKPLTIKSRWFFFE